MEFEELLVGQPWGSGDPWGSQTEQKPPGEDGTALLGLCAQETGISVVWVGGLPHGATGLGDTASGRKLERVAELEKHGTGTVAISTLCPWLVSMSRCFLVFSMSGMLSFYTSGKKTS